MANPSQSPDSQSYSGAQNLSSATSDYNQMHFVFQSLLGKVATTTLVEVMAVQAAGELAPVGLIDVRPMVAQLDGSGNATPHGTIHNVPYFRLQGGANAIIIDPVVGDIGIAVFASRDISSVKANKAAANPGSRRQNSMADALYIGGVLNGTPEQYIRYSAEGIEIKPAETVTILGDLQVTGTVTADVDVVGGGKSLSTHTHSGVTTGGGITGPPV